MHYLKQKNAVPRVKGFHEMNFLKYLQQIFILFGAPLTIKRVEWLFFTFMFFSITFITSFFMLLHEILHAT